MSQAAGAQIDAIMARRQAVNGANEPEIGPDEADAVTLFFTLGTQWRFHPFAGSPTGIDYAAIPAVAQMLGIVMTPMLMHDLRIMEGAALAVWNAK